MRRSISLLAVAVVVTSHAAAAGPILRPKKYHGPIGPRTISLRIGFLGGASNAEMNDFLDRQHPSPERSVSDDFGNGLSVEAAFMYKPHPNFAWRVQAGWARLESPGDGFFVDRSAALPDTVPSPVLDFERTFRSDLFTIEGSGIYFFSDAAVRDFQPYVGGGFSAGFPHERFEEVRIDRDTGERTTITDSEWSVEAGVHGVLGAFYYVTSHAAINVEGRVQVMQSRFPLQTPPSLGPPETVHFVVDYSGFFLSVGLTQAF